MVVADSLVELSSTSQKLIGKFEERLLRVDCSGFLEGWLVTISHLCESSGSRPDGSWIALEVMRVARSKDVMASRSTLRFTPDRGGISYKE